MNHKVLRLELSVYPVKDGNFEMPGQQYNYAWVVGGDKHDFDRDAAHKMLDNMLKALEIE